MGYLEGLLGGFTSRKREYEQQQLQEADLANQREGKVYEALINSPDPHVKALAISGLLASVQRPQRAKGLRGWLGDMASNPAMSQIEALVNQPVPTEQPVMETSLPSRQISGALPTPQSDQGNLAQPTTSATTGGPVATPQPTPAAVGKPPASLLASTPSPGQTRQVGTRTVMAPRQIFQSPEDALLASKRASSQGDVEGMVAGLVASGVPEVQARETVRQHLLRTTAGGVGTMQSIAGELPDGTPAFAAFDRQPGSATFGKYIDPNSGTALEGFRPRTTTGSRQINDRESIARELFGKPASLLTAGEMAQVNQRLLSFTGEKAGATETGRGEAAADVPLNTQQRFAATTDLSKQWQTINAPYREMQRQLTLMQTGLDRVDADPIGGSQAVLVTFQKVLDPSSVVRESEYARSPQGLGLLDRLQGMVEKYSAGGAGVPKPILDQMVQTARQFLVGMQGWNEQHRSRIQKTAESYGIDPGLVLGADAQGGGAATPSAQVATPPPSAPVAPSAPASGAPPSLFHGADGELHVGSPTGPIYRSRFAVGGGGQ